MEQAIAVVGALEVAIDLRAEESLCEGMLRIAGDTHGASVLHRHEHRAGVGAVVGARTTNDVRHGGRTRRCVHGRSGIEGVAEAIQFGMRRPAMDAMESPA